jgi:DMSO/TMAO reductase YedYZ molybdopterin-dependent catalytic subunit
MGIQYMAQRRHFWVGAILGLVLTLPLVGLMFLGSALAGLPQAQDIIFSFIRDRLPGGLLTFGIEQMVKVFSALGTRVDTASKNAESFFAILTFLFIGLVFGLVYSWLFSRTNGGMVIGLLLWIGTLGVDITAKPGSIDSIMMPAVWFLVLDVFWGLSIAWAYSQFMAPGITESAEPNSDRRRFLTQFAMVVGGITVGSFGLGALLSRSPESSVADLPTEFPTQSATGDAAQVATQSASSFIPAPGTRDELTPLDRFYRVDINLGSPPDIDSKTWNLSVGGLVDSPYTLTYDQLVALPFLERDATLECISNDVGGSLISETRWRAVKLGDLLTKAKLKTGVVEIKFGCDDGYSESLPLNVAMDEGTLLVYGMNGKPLPAAHGFPARIFVPDRYGMKNPKWVNSIEAIDQPHDGYWEQRGWDKDAIIKITSVIDTDSVNSKQFSTAPIGGIAFGGGKGISKVEVSIDDGPWQMAELKEGVSALTWRLWRYDSHMTPGNHSVTVRAYDAKGNVQLDEIQPTHPNGASGYHRREINVF